MSDRELLEKAAMAAGHALIWGDVYEVGDDTIDCSDMPYIKSTQIDDLDVYWNPLEDDGDALRLAVKLRMDVKQWNSLAIATKAWNKHAEENTSTQCPYAATRRAIVRAAAAIHEEKGQHDQNRP